MNKETFQQFYDKAYEYHRMAHLEAVYIMKLYEESSNSSEFILKVLEDDLLEYKTKQAFEKAGSYMGVFL